MQLGAGLWGLHGPAARPGRLACVAPARPRVQEKRQPRRIAVQASSGEALLFWLAPLGKPAGEVAPTTTLPARLAQALDERLGDAADAADRVVDPPVVAVAEDHACGF